MPSDKRIVYEVTCPCGGIVKLDARGFGKSILCRACEGTLVVAWGRDARNTETIPVIVRHVPGKKRPVLAGPKGPTLKTQILPQAKFFDCVCGERNVLIGVGPGKSVNCSGCDRVHLLEATSAEAAKPAPAAAPPAVARIAPPAVAPPAVVAMAAPPPKAVAPPPPPPPPPAPARKLKLGEILCKCGEILPPRTSKTGREFECKLCGRKGHVVPGQEANGTPRIDTVFTYEPPAAALYKPPPPPAPVLRPPAPAGAAAQWTCPCGTPVPAYAAMTAKISACPACGREIRLEKRQAPMSTMTVMKPVFAEAKAAEFQEQLSATAACPCGAELPVSESLAGRTVRCDACSRELEVVAKNGHVRLRERG